MDSSQLSDPVDREYKDWMMENLAKAERTFGVRTVGTPTTGWRLRSIGSAAVGDEHYWLRVVSEDPQWLPGSFWTGNEEANSIAGIAKPEVLATVEWEDDVWRRRVRVEMMTHLPGLPCSPTDVLQDPLDLDLTWWEELELTLNMIKSISTTRVSSDSDTVRSRIQNVFGSDAPVDIREWTTVHGDLHWGNLRAAPFGLLDWEMWGSGPRGTDEATLYCHSLAVPRIAEDVHTAFAPLLDSPAGRMAQLYVSARILRRAVEDYPELAFPVRLHAEQLLREPHLL